MKDPRRFTMSIISEDSEVLETLVVVVLDDDDDFDAYAEDDDIDFLRVRSDFLKEDWRKDTGLPNGFTRAIRRALQSEGE